MKLNNGSEIVRLKISADPTARQRFTGTVLAYRGSGWHDAFVTWRVYSDDGGETFEAAHGNYFPSFNEASQDFDER